MAGRSGSRSPGSVPQRQSGHRAFRTKVLLIGEGRETERHYFDGLCREDDVTARFAVTIKKGPGWSPEAVVKEALWYKEKAERRGEMHDHVCCALDVEGPNKRKSLATA